MCGIFFSLSKHAPCVPNSSIKECLRRRGPLAQKECILEIGGTNQLDESLHACIYSTVLPLRGEQIVEQPLVDAETGSFLCWNGEAWSISGDHLEGRYARFTQHYAECIDGNDTETVFKLLLNASSHSAVDEVSWYQPVLDAISLVSGPHAFVYYDAHRKCIFYARDSLGRRSLLQCINPEGNILLTSSACGRSFVGDDGPREPASITGHSDTGQWAEVEADGVYIIDLSMRPVQEQFQVPLDPLTKVKFWQWHQYHCILVPYTPRSTRWNDADPSVNIHYGLLNLTPSATSEDLCGKAPSSTVLPLHLGSQSVLKLEGLLRHSLELRFHGLGTRTATESEDGTDQCCLAVLFSGGLDCTVLARLAHDILPQSLSIDLLNVAFENPRIHSRAKCESPFELCPDRITGRASSAELKNVCPDRIWRFVEINIPYSETLAHREVITSLIYPHNTEMDLSIGMALYFAARGAGQVLSENGSTASHYATSARVMLSGLGADELFGGYQRHATAFSRNGLVGRPGAPGLLDELQLDVSRLGKRNLGRDDRVLSHWGRETRFPYLDEELINWAMAAPVWEKTGFGTGVTAEIYESESSPDLEAGKKVLRLLAYKLGMKEVAREKKRAIQFGARTAKMETGKTRGTTLLS